MRQRIDLTQYDSIKEEFKQLYSIQFMSLEQLAEHFNMSVKRVSKLVKYFNLHRDSGNVRSATFNKTNSKNRQYLNIKSRISKEDIIKWYVDEDHSYNDAPSHFGISQWQFDKLCKDYSIKKDKKKSRQKGFITAEAKYGKGNSNNKTKAIQTIINKYGSVENFYKKRQETLEQNNLKKYGFKYKATADLLVNHSKQYLKVWGSKEESIHYLESLGYKPTVSELMLNLNATINNVYLWIEKWDLGSYITIIKSNYEQDIINWLEEQGCVVDRNNRQILDGLELDIYLPDYKVAIEFNGNYWHSNQYKIDKKYHFNKSYQCEQKGIRLIHIYQYQWENPIKQQILKSIILNAIKKNNNIIYARKCILKELTKDDVEFFSELNSLHGHRNTSIYLGLFYNGELVEIMTFGKAFFSRNKAIDYECIRSITKLNTTVIGGMNKLLHYFITKYHPKSILYYIDYNTHNGSSMEKLGFKFQSYSYHGLINIANSKEVAEKYGPVFNRKPEKNKEILEYTRQGKVLTIYDAGVKRYMWTAK